ncbi:MAG: PTS sugar transporter subunit IIA [Kiritimatiellae bacterium]|nr:PTS sugar transporter subunit IIA [Kiritimatiellia bacterium]
MISSTSIILASAAVAVLAGTITYILLTKRGLGKNRAKKKADRGKSSRSSVLEKYIGNFVMVPSFRANSKREAIEKLIEIAHGSFPEIVCNVDHAREAVFAREESMPTGLDNGIAVPHGRTDGVNQITGVLALVDNSENENGIIPDYETIDHSKIQVLCLTLIPDSISTPYFQLIAAFIRILQDAENLDQLLDCKTSSEMTRFICSVA